MTLNISNNKTNLLNENFYIIIYNYIYLSLELKY